MEKRTPIQKSILRHGLKEIDKKFNKGKVALPSRAKALEKAKH